MGDNVFVPSSLAGDWILVVVIKPANINAYHNLVVSGYASTRPVLWIDPSYNYELNYGGGTGAKAAGTGSDGWDIVIADSGSISSTSIALQPCNRPQCHSCLPASRSISSITTVAKHFTAK